MVNDDLRQRVTILEMQLGAVLKLLKPVNFPTKPDPGIG